MKRSNKRCFGVLVVLLLLGMSCSKGPSITGTETGNPDVTGRLALADGTPASGVWVDLRPVNYLAPVSAKMAAVRSFATLASTQTDSLGNFTFDSIAVGAYILECIDDEAGTGALIDSVVIDHSDSTTELATDTLKPLGSIVGQIQLPESLDASQVRVLVYGLDRVATPDSLGGYTFPGLAEGTYSLRFQIVANQGIDVHNAMVVSGDTTRPPKAILPGAEKIYSPKASGAVNVDGLLDEADWATARAITFSNPAVSENVVTVRTLWDSAFLYVSYEVADTMLMVDGTSEVFLDDAAEFFLDPQHDAGDSIRVDDLQVLLNIEGQSQIFQGDVEIPSTITGKMAISLTGYNMEIAVPWALTGKTPADSMTMGVLFAGDDNDQTDPVQFDWLGLKVPGNEIFKQPKLWGDLILLP